eukprot:g29765.t1
MAVAWALQLQSKLASISLLCASALVSVLRVVCGHHTWAQVVVGAVMGSAMAVAWMLLGTEMIRRPSHLATLVVYTLYLCGSVVFLAKGIKKSRRRHKATIAASGD